MLLQGKTAVVIAATGTIGSAVARQLRSEGATVHLAGRDAEALRRLAAECEAPWSVVDATDEVQVRAMFDHVSSAGAVPDIVFNGIGPRAAAAGYGQPSVSISRDSFLLPLHLVLWSQFLTARAAAPAMMERGSGAIVLLSASLSGLFIPLMSGITASCGAIEALTRTLAAEYGPAGVRVNCVRAGAMPATRTIQETTASIAGTLGMSPDALAPQSHTGVLGRPLQVEELALSVAYVASDAASGIAGQIINVCAGTLVS